MGKLTRLRIEKHEERIKVVVSCEIGQTHCCNDRWLALLDYPLESVDWKSLFSEYTVGPELSVTIFGINVTSEFLRKLFEMDCLRKVHTLGVFYGSFDQEARDTYFQIIAEKKPHTLYFGFHMDNSCTIPTEILDHVTNELHYDPCHYDYYSNYDHFDDDLLEKWCCPPKTMMLDNCIVGFTLAGIEKQLNKLRSDKVKMQSYTAHLGCLKNVSPDEVRSFLTSFEGLKFKEDKPGSRTYFKITSFFDEACSISINPSTDIDFDYYHLSGN